MTNVTAIRTAPDESGAGRCTGVEERIAALQGQLELLRAQVRQAQQLASLGTAAATYAHEVSNLLTPVLNFVRSAVGSDSERIREKALTVTLQNVEMLIAMSDYVLEIGAARPRSPGIVSVREAVEAAQVSLCRDLSKDGIRFLVEVAETVTVWCDGLQLRQVLFNLFLNAREAMIDQRDRRLEVRARVTGDRGVIEVQNTGSPIPSDLLPYVFDPLQSSKLTDGSRRSRCSGLGLALCRDLIEGNGGTLEVASGAEHGTVFTITLPTKEGDS